MFTVFAKKGARVLALVLALLLALAPTAVLAAPSDELREHTVTMPMVGTSPADGLAVASYPEMAALELPEGVKLMAAPDLNILSSLATVMVDGFESESVWQYENGEAQRVSKLDRYPYAPYEGQQCLSLPMTEVGKWYTLSTSFVAGLDLSSATTFTYVLFCPAFEGSEYETRLTLKSSSGDFSATAPLVTDRYTAVSFDVSAFAGRGAITDITIELRYADTAASGATPTLLLDTVLASDRDLDACLRYGSDSWFLYGGEITDSGHSLVFDVNGTVPFFELYQLTDKIFGDCNAITLKLINRTPATSVTLSYAPALFGLYSEEQTYTLLLEQSEEVQYLRFPFAPGGVEQIRFSFSGKLQGQIELLDISPSYTAEDTDALFGDITSCRLSEDGRMVEINGYLSESACSIFRNYKLQVYATSYATDDSEIESGLIKNVAQTTLTEHFTVQIPLSKLIGESDLTVAAKQALQRRFAIGISYNNRVMLIDSGKYITNPELLNKAEPLPLPVSKKGALAPDTVVAEASHTVVEVPLQQLFTTGDTDLKRGYSLSTGEQIEVGFDRTYLAQLDRLLTSYANENIAVTLLLTLGRSVGENAEENEFFDRLLLHPAALQYEGDRHCAFNTDSQRALTYLTAAGEMLAERYATSDGIPAVTAIALGKEIDRRADASGGYFMGDALLPDFAESYVTAFRTLYAAVRSVSACDVIISFSRIYDDSIYAQSRFGFDIATLLPYLRELIVDGGDVAWHLALDPYGAALESEASPLDDYRQLNGDNLATLLPRLAQGGQQVLLLPEQSTPMAADGFVTADFIRLYYLICQKEFTYVRCLIPNYQPESTLFAALDTAEGGALCDPYVALLGFESLQDMLTAYGYQGDAVVARTLDSAAFTAAATLGSGNAKIPLFSWKEGDSGDWEKNIGCDALTAGITAFDRQNLLSAAMQVEQGSAGAVQNVSGVALDLTPLTFIDLPIHISGLPADTKTVSLTVLLYAGQDRMAYTGVLNADSWTTVRLSLKEWDQGVKGPLERIKVLVTSSDGGSLGSPTLLLDQPQGISLSYTAEQLQHFYTPGGIAAQSKADPRMILALASVIVITAAVWVFSILGRLKNIDKSDETE